MRLRVLIALPLLIAGLTATSIPVHAATEREVIRVYHQAVTPIATSGSGVGEVRTFFIPIAVDGTAADGQYLSGTLTTMAQAVSEGLELRSSNLTFVFGDEADQLVVGGVSLYPPTGATLAPGTKTVRPVLGGSGRYDGARGQVVSRNYGADGWTHTFRITVLD